jgi:hypothetical protein
MPEDQLAGRLDRLVRRLGGRLATPAGGGTGRRHEGGGDEERDELAHRKSSVN